MAFKSITGARGIDWKVGVDLDGLPETIQEVTDHQAQSSSRRSSSSRARR